jgi:RHS repeat-associated protein
VGNVSQGFIDGNTTGDDYVYDANGNMIVDNNKHITSITYNHLNLPTQITFGTTGNIVYIYTASGQKVKKVVTSTTPSSVVTTDYLGGYQYSNTSLQFFPTVEGYVKNTPVSGTNTYSYVFNYTDHLGNVRLSYTKNPSTNALDIIEENNYYPFGLKHNGYNPITPTPEYKYQYNGKELQDELGLNVYDYGARNYDPALGRWMNVDPFSEEMTSHSPYNYVFNKPINATDPDGRSPIYNSQTGQYVINGQQVSFEESLAYANTGGNSDGKNKNTIDGGSGDGNKKQQQDNTSPWQVGWEWLTGNGTRNHKFRDGDDFTEMLKKHEHIQETKNKIRKILVSSGGQLLKGSNPYKLGGLKGIPLYLRDYSTLLTGGLTGNLAVTYLGSYALKYEVVSVNKQTGTAVVVFNVSNNSTIESATHPPVVGYTSWWQNNIGSSLNKTFQQGPLSKTSQTFTWKETIKWR